MDGTNLEYRPPTVGVGNWQLPHNLSWSFQHFAEFLPTALISRGQGPASVLPINPLDLRAISRPAAFPTEAPMSVGSVIDSTDTDA
ncbi:hypothetical protein ACIGB6_05610 [Paeniglutamicibacter gangotriensis]|uniref:Uncharacterized protein n=1 Tax=Paeniglutamicibacter gangotriensis Lz1y TaxID=1276920 RepID=M7MSD6_9MICC|nr:hypothetical protein [Paeniglutamicibacter gangotriensis]EMQ99302.1 hypothetical protein ADIAG_01295 [Paeniglutamicibacter gangotriensis Lz1y]